MGDLVDVVADAHVGHDVFKNSYVSPNMISFV